MEAMLEFLKLSVLEIEDLKSEHRIDDRIADILIPKSDRVRRDPTVNLKLKALVKEKVDPWLIQTIQLGGHKIPRKLLDRPPSRENKRPRADALTEELRNFLRSASIKASKKDLTEKQLRAYARQLRVTIEEALWRKVLS